MKLFWFILLSVCFVGLVKSTGGGPEDDEFVENLLTNIGANDPHMHTNKRKSPGDDVASKSWPKPASLARFKDAFFNSRMEKIAGFEGRLYPKLLVQCLEALKQKKRTSMLRKLNSIIPREPRQPSIIITGMDDSSLAELITSRIHSIQSFITNLVHTKLASIEFALSFIGIVKDLIMNDKVTHENDQVDMVVSWAFGHTFANRMDIRCFEMNLQKIAPGYGDMADQSKTTNERFELAKRCLEQASAYMPNTNDRQCPDPATPDTNSVDVDALAHGFKRFKTSKN